MEHGFAKGLIESLRQAVEIARKRKAGSAELTAQEDETIHLSAREQSDFAATLLTPPEPGPRLRQAVQTYRSKGKK